VAEHTREHRSFLAAAEKKLLIAIARRLPTRINSDHLTALALVAMALAGAGYALARWDVRALWVAVGALGLNWFGDSLDGTVARVRKVERPRYGFYVDHVLDIVGATLLFAGLAASGFMNPLIALALLIGYLLVTGEVFLATSVTGVFRMSFSGFGPTELRILLAIGTVTLFGDPYVDLGSFGRMRLFDFGGLIGIAGMAFALTVNVVRNTTALARQEPRTLPNGAPAADGNLHRSVRLQADLS
jgi:phosphatidylglycerophosphate synthase